LSFNCQAIALDEQIIRQSLRRISQTATFLSAQALDILPYANILSESSFIRALAGLTTTQSNTLTHALSSWLIFSHGVSLLLNHITNRLPVTVFGKNKLYRTPYRNAMEIFTVLSKMCL